ncbi:MAG: molybdopterin-dependent oxidoreductase, partial [Dehalococcoidia bacterium]|nr:molybdopterin-dependent oxidoreductase [Dehalococcoidia bacterium]
MVTQSYSVVGKRMPDVAGVAKVTGAAQFVSDMRLPNMLIAKVLHSPFAHAKILDIDTSKAERLPGVGAVITYKDSPQKQYTGTLMNLQSYTGIEVWGVYDQRILENRVRYWGEAVAAVAAVNEKVAEEALALIKVRYKKLPAVFDELEALEKGAPQVHDFVERRQDDGYPKREPVVNNLAVHVCHKPVGDVKVGFKEAEYIVDETGYTTKQRQSALETFCCLASFDAQGKVTLWSQIQLPFLLRRMLAYIFDMPIGMIRIRTENIGGGFGAGLAVFREPIAVLLAQKTGKPVKLVYSRQEEFVDRQTRACLGPYNLKMGVKKDGTITAMERKVISKAGAYIDCAALTALIATSCCNPLYRTRTFKAEADVVYTNKVGCGAMRGFGNPEECFVREQVMDEAAAKLGMDPLEFRQKNLCQVGDPGAFGPDFPITTTAMADCIKLGAKKIGWKKKYGKKLGTGNKRRGVGVSCMSHVSGAWPVHIEHSNALIKFNEDATVSLIMSTPPIGTHAYTSMAQIVAEILGMPFEEVKVVWGDTDATLFEIGSHASRTMYIVGNTVYRAAQDARKKLLTRAAKKLGVSADELDVKNKVIFVKSDPKKSITSADVTKEAIYTLGDVEQLMGTCSYRPSTSPPPYQAAFTEVEVDTETGEVTPVKMVVVNDSGQSINPMTVEGQLEGGAAQGLGFALWEDPVMDEKTGCVLTDDFDTYKIASTLDMPELDIVLLNQPDPTGPCG